MSNLTMESLMESIRKIPPDPVAEYMRARGYDPDDGALLVVPHTEKDEFGANPPKYVRFSRYVTGALLVAKP